MKKTIPLILILAVLGIFGCGETGFEKKEPLPNLRPATLKPFSSCEEVVERIRTSLRSDLEKQYDSLQKRDWCYSYGAADGAPASGPAAMPAPSGEAVSFTGTNVQEEGVDEADLMKTDGHYLYALNRPEKTVHIFEIHPAGELTEVKQIPISSWQPDSLYLAKDKLVILSAAMEAGHWSGCSSSKTTVAIWDVAQPEDPQLQDELNYNGCLVSSRRIGRKLYLAMQTDGVSPRLSYWPDGYFSCDEEETPLQKSIAKLRESNEAVLQGLAFSDIFPAYSSMEGDDCSHLYFADDVSGTSIASVVGIDLRPVKDEAQITSVLGTASTVYASSNAMYLAAPADRDFTMIHQFRFEGGEESFRYTGSQAVEGQLLNSFALSEFEGVLRIATTVGNSDSRLYTLNADEENLPVMGSVSGLGKGEKIYAVRFLGPKAFVVTFKKVDPLYVVDLSDPQEPSVKGELKIPGFSTYLHILDGNHLIGIGHAADDQGSFTWFQGVQLSLFDVSDSAQPRAIQQITIGGRGTSSDAVFNHHAVTFDGKSHLLVLPIDYYEGDGLGSNVGNFQYSGFHLYDVDLRDGFLQERVIRETTADETTSSWGSGFWSEDLGRRSLLFSQEGEDALITLTLKGVTLYRLEEGDPVEASYFPFSIDEGEDWYLWRD